MALHLRIASHSAVGLVRKMNQDSGYASPHLLVVADGMGGAAAGDLASAVAIDSIKRLDTPDLLTGSSGGETSVVGADGSAARPTDGTEQTVVVPLVDGAPVEQGPAGLNPLLGRFAATVAEANGRIADLVAADYALEGMGTTVTGAVFDGQRIGLVHIGDSRAYLLRDGRLEQITDDHSLVAELVRRGELSPQAAEVHPQRSVITRALGTDPGRKRRGNEDAFVFRPPLFAIADGMGGAQAGEIASALAAGALVLLCSDGLSAMVRDEEIARVLESAGAAPREAAEALVAAANAAGGEDNVTVVLFEVVDAGSALPSLDATEVPATAAGEPLDEDGPTLEDVRRHGAGKGSRWPALLLVLAILAIAAFALWWGLVR
jgi:protein phosphatase